jgi:hypothetical protein
VGCECLAVSEWPDGVFGLLGTFLGGAITFVVARWAFNRERDERRRQRLLDARAEWAATLDQYIVFSIGFKKALITEKECLHAGKDFIRANALLVVLEPEKTTQESLKSFHKTAVKGWETPVADRITELEDLRDKVFPFLLSVKAPKKAKEVAD